ERKDRTALPSLSWMPSGFLLTPLPQIFLVPRVLLNQNSNLLYKYTKKIPYIQGKKQLFLLFF
ncbi:MAG: hypothetical protein CMM99_05410, partial [Rickettsiales bacterium]|nr:hypothetical protein [Rickettsiales bacterium]